MAFQVFQRLVCGCLAIIKPNHDWEFTRFLEDAKPTAKAHNSKLAKFKADYGTLLQKEKTTHTYLAGH